ncbi:MAG: hypothetical protein LBT98_02705, partial [Puniceicoccales bacterium]|nr:hypothetical protein [Puniceicoccales bacterium]
MHHFLLIASSGRMDAIDSHSANVNSPTDCTLIRSRTPSSFVCRLHILVNAGHCPNLVVAFFVWIFARVSGNGITIEFPTETLREKAFFFANTGTEDEEEATDGWAEEAKNWWTGETEPEDEATVTIGTEEVETGEAETEEEAEWTAIKIFHRDLANYVCKKYLPCPVGMNRKLWNGRFREAIIHLAKVEGASSRTLPAEHWKRVCQFIEDYRTLACQVSQELKKNLANPQERARLCRIADGIVVCLETLSDHLSTCEDAAATGLAEVTVRMKIQKILLSREKGPTPQERVELLLEAYLVSSAADVIRQLARVIESSKQEMPAEIIEVELLVMNLLASLNLPCKMEPLPMRYGQCAVGALNVLHERIHDPKTANGTVPLPPWMKEDLFNAETDGVGEDFEKRMWEVCADLGLSNLSDGAKGMLRGILRGALYRLGADKIATTLASQDGSAPILFRCGEKIWKACTLDNVATGVPPRTVPVSIPKIFSKPTPVLTDTVLATIYDNHRTLAAGQSPGAAVTVQSLRKSHGNKKLGEILADLCAKGDSTDNTLALLGSPSARRSITVHAVAQMLEKAALPQMPHPLLWKNVVQVVHAIHNEDLNIFPEITATSSAGEVAA